ncbi:hypothetical protein GCM10020221_30960 [Streptomyces thioluteus]|uniref:Uncharacterized protein n=1 Tax=Streptomyces thioluteus TaxID=66431 RepID=A0ABN3X1Z0_STRTU
MLLVACVECVTAEGPRSEPRAPKRDPKSPRPTKDGALSSLRDTGTPEPRAIGAPGDPHAAFPQ